MSTPKESEMVEREPTREECVEWMTYQLERLTQTSLHSPIDKFFMRAILAYLRAPALVLTDKEREALACADYYLVKASRMQATPHRNHEIGQYAIALRAIASRGKL